MSERDWADELERYLRDRLAEVRATIEQPGPPSGLRISPPLGLEESKYFLLGLEAGLFQLDEEAYVQSELFPPPSEGDTRQKECQLFWYDSPPPRLFREGVIQLATASALILKRGWLKSQVVIETRTREYRSLACGVDLLLKSATDEILACIVVKRSEPELQKLITDLRACCKRGAHAQDDCGFPQNHPKYEFCVRDKPTYFWGVAPEADTCLGLTYDGGAIEMEQLPSLPPRSIIELGHK